MTIDAAPILDALRILLEPGQVTELRAINVSTKAYPRPHTVSGNFDDPAALAAAAARVAPYAMSTYVVLNRIDPALLARANNRIRIMNATEHSTSDANVKRRLYFLVDCDPVRAADVSSTDEEHEAGLARMREIRSVLIDSGWPSPILADSGNGGHLLFHVDLENDEATKKLFERALKALAMRFNDSVVKLDETVFNAARVCKLYGTPARKGDDMPNRPHRVARLLDVPDDLVPVDRPLLESLAQMMPDEQLARKGNRGKTGEAIDLDRWIQDNNLTVNSPNDWNGGKLWVLPVCPWNDEHRNRSAFLIQFSSGAITAGCHHASCAGKGWHELRDIVEPGWRDRQRNTSRSRKGGKDDSTDLADDDENKRPPQAEILVGIASNADLFHDPTGEAYARMAVADHFELYPIRNKAFRGWLVREYYEGTLNVPNAEALGSALNVIEAMAKFDGECRPVYLRVAPGEDGQIWVDLANPEWSVVCITAAGWEILPDSPVMFRRSGGCSLYRHQYGEEISTTSEISSM